MFEYLLHVEAFLDILQVYSLPFPSAAWILAIQTVHKLPVTVVTLGYRTPEEHPATCVVCKLMA